MFTIALMRYNTLDKFSEDLKIQMLATTICNYMQTGCTEDQYHKFTLF